MIGANLCLPAHSWANRRQRSRHRLNNFLVACPQRPLSAMEAWHRLLSLRVILALLALLDQPRPVPYFRLLKPLPSQSISLSRLLAMMLPPTIPRPPSKRHWVGSGVSCLPAAARCRKSQKSRYLSHRRKKSPLSHLNANACSLSLVRLALQ